MQLLYVCVTDGEVRYRVGFFYNNATDLKQALDNALVIAQQSFRRYMPGIYQVAKGKNEAEAYEEASDSSKARRALAELLRAAVQS